ncbi:NADH:flavin oxidoreductase [Malaciobacter molluscorum]|uniref:oxidoreductase n=1 Tax=Malaciobacter molluscorum TaxID=1032072 RepID=UPI00100A5F3A|nr:tRNA-dihydrouridine synthase [Malaciobacter molluscorum]RXJ97441.1 NADH:flavin oxidoreductase [Malaciobacter molluscorum]
MNDILKSRNIDNLNLKNSLIMAPCCMYSAQKDGKLTHFHFSHYEARAIGGVGLIIVEATAIEPRGKISDKDLALHNKDQALLHKQLVENCKSYGAKMGIQLAHAGRKSEVKDSTPIAPSSIKFSDNYKQPKELTIDEIKEIKKSFVNSAILAKEAGYDLIELHSAHGYLLCEFNSPLTNKRDDIYGGSLENRCRLTVEIAKEIKQSTALALSVRISATEWSEGGWSVEDSVYLSKELEKVGVNVIHVSAGGNQANPELMPKLEPLYQANYAKQIKENINIPVIAVGLINTYEQCQEIYDNNCADFVAMGRELLRNPNVIQYFLKEQQEKDKFQKQYARAFI